jgi:hypothetical protein
MDTTTTLEAGAEGRGTRAKRGQWKGVECSTDGCDRPAKCRGFCSTHYNKFLWASGHRSPSARAAKADPLRRAKLRSRYGLSHKGYAELLEQQDHRCAVCRKHETEVAAPKHWNVTLCVDHCAETGNTRGLLCNYCNLLIKRGKATADTLQRAADYVRLHDERNRVDYT